MTMNFVQINEYKIAFKYNIDSVKFFQNVYIVLLDIPTEIKEVNNIFAINDRCELLWRIQDPAKLYNIINDVPYVGIRIDDQGVLIATNFNGVTYSVDINTGNVIGRGTTK